METLAAVSSRQLTSTLALPSTVTVNFNGRVCSSLPLLRSTARVRSLRCSAISSLSVAEQSERFFEASKNGNLIPLYRSIFSDHLTPVLAYRCLVKEDDRDAPSFLFEAVDPGFKDSNVGRYSIIGAQPTIEIVAKENMVTVMDHREGRRTEEIVEDPMTVPQRSRRDGCRNVLMRCQKHFVVDGLVTSLMIQCVMWRRKSCHSVVHHQMTEIFLIFILACMIV